MIKNFQDIISQIKEQIPIHELISEHIPLKKSGSGYVGLCPFHNDHKPSMQVNSQKGIFKCFSCGTGGDIIYFYSQITKKKFYESVIDLAEKYGFHVEYGEEDKTEAQIRNHLYELNKAALDFFKKNLFNSENVAALSYLKDERGFTQETIDKFEIGYAVNSWDSLLNHLSKEKKFPSELLVSSGLFVQKESSNSYYDRFRSRIVIPIFNEKGSVIAFGGRTITGDEPKYLNSPETLIFNKGSCLYGLNYAKEEIRKKDSIILTEGYFDVIAAHQKGLSNTVATLGTAFTMKQARLLGKYTESKNLYLCMDSDKAGMKAVESIFRLINDKNSPTYLYVKVVSDLGGKDLDESLKVNDVSFVMDKLNNGQELIYFMLDSSAREYVSSDSEIKKKNIFEELLQILCGIQDPFEQKKCASYIAHKLSIDEELLITKIKDKSKSKQKYSKKPTQNTELAEDLHTMYSQERFKHAEIELLSLYITSFPDSNKDMKSELSKIEFIDEKHRLIKEYLDNVSEVGLISEQIINNMMVEFSEYKHIMSVVSDLAWRIQTDSSSAYTKNKEKVLKEAKEWIDWWVHNKQKLKSLTVLLKDCKDSNEEADILVQMMQIVKDMNQIRG